MHAQLAEARQAKARAHVQRLPALGYSEKHQLNSYQTSGRTPCMGFRLGLQTLALQPGFGPWGFPLEPFILLDQDIRDKVQHQREKPATIKATTMSGDRCHCERPPGNPAGQRREEGGVVIM